MEEGLRARYPQEIEAVIKIAENGDIHNSFDVFMPNISVRKLYKL
jgi:hypothetical protein